jgi:hypothetical protein
MNIFEILCYGDGRINEPQMSSVLAFILDPSAPHGYKFAPLNEFINIFYEQGRITFKNLGLKNSSDIQNWLRSFKLISLDLELISNDENTRKRSDLDLVIRFYKETIPDLTIIIENKINDGASRGRKNQLQEQYSSFSNELNEQNRAIEEKRKTPPIIFVYLTPKLISDKEMVNSKQQWEGLQLHENSTDQDLDFKVNIAWEKSNQENNENAPSITDLLQTILKNERDAVINPGSSHADLLFRSLIKFIKNKFKKEDYAFVEYGDNNFTIVSEYDFWKTWSVGNKKDSKNFALKVIEHIKEKSDRSLNLKGLSNRYVIKVVASKLRLNVYLDDVENPHYIHNRSPKGRIANLRYDGKTSKDRIDLTFDRTEGHEFEEFISNLPKEINEDLAKAFDSSGNQFRTVLYINIKKVKDFNLFFNYLENFIEEAIEAAIIRLKN